MSDYFLHLEKPTPADSGDFTWKPSGPRPWPDRVNEELSRYGAGLEDHEKRIAMLERELYLLELLVNELKEAIRPK